MKPQHPSTPGSETHSGGGGRGDTGGGPKGTGQGILENSITLGIAFCGMMKPLGISLVHGAEDTTHGMLFKMLCQILPHRLNAALSRCSGAPRSPPVPAARGGAGSARPRDKSRAGRAARASAW